MHDPKIKQNKKHKTETNKQTEKPSKPTFLKAQTDRNIRNDVLRNILEGPEQWHKW